MAFNMLPPFCVKFCCAKTSGTPTFLKLIVAAPEPVFDNSAAPVPTSLKSKFPNTLMVATPVEEVKFTFELMPLAALTTKFPPTAKVKVVVPVKFSVAPELPVLKKLKLPLTVVMAPVKPMLAV